MDLIDVAGWVNVAVTIGYLIYALVACIYITNNNHLEFNAIWGARLALVLVGCLWVVRTFFTSTTIHTLQNITSAHPCPLRHNLSLTWFKASHYHGSASLILQLTGNFTHAQRGPLGAS